MAASPILQLRFGKRCGPRFADFERSCERSTHGEQFAYRVFWWLRNVAEDDRAYALEALVRRRRIEGIRAKETEIEARTLQLEFQLQLLRSDIQTRDDPAVVARLAASEKAILDQLPGLLADIEDLKRRATEEDVWLKEHWTECVKRFAGIEGFVWPIGAMDF